MASHVAVLNGGRVEQFGAPEELVRHPATAFVATFVGTPPANLVPVASLPAARAAGLPGHALAMYRPEDLTISAAATPDSLPFDFAEASPVAGRTMLTGIEGALRMTAVGPAELPTAFSNAGKSTSSSMTKCRSVASKNCMKTEKACSHCDLAAAVSASIKKSSQRL